MLKNFVYRLYPTPHQEVLLNNVLQECRWLYNCFLEQRKSSYETTGKGPTLYDQQNTIPQLKLQRSSLESVYSQVLQNVAMRVDLTFQAFFRRVKVRENPGYPRFKSSHRYHSFTYPQVPHRCSFNPDSVSLAKIGLVKAVIHRELQGIPKTCTVRRSSTGKWYVVVACKTSSDAISHASTKQVGIDVGLTTFATLSDQTEIKRQRFFKTDEKELVKANRKLSKEKLGTPERNRRRKPVARIHERIRFRRHNFAHQESRKVVNKYGFIAVEDLEVNRMVHNKCLSKSISDAAWSLFFILLFYKAESAGRTIVKVNPAYTTQDCSKCGHRQKMLLSERTYSCPCCKLVIDRDLNASLNILRLGLQSHGTQPEEALGSDT